MVPASSSGAKDTRSDTRPSGSGRRGVVVVAYDIASDRRRNRVARMLADFGTRVQKSVFECRISVTDREQLEARVRSVVNPARDRVRFYRLCDGCLARVRAIPVDSGTAPPVQFV